MSFLTMNVESITVTPKEIVAKATILYVLLPHQIDADGEGQPPLVVPLCPVTEFKVPAVLFKRYFPRGTHASEWSMKQIELTLIQLFQELPFMIIPPKPINVEDVPPFKRVDYTNKQELLRKKRYFDWQSLGLMSPPNQPGGPS